MRDDKKVQITIDRETVQQTLKCSPDQYPKVLEEKFPHVLEKILKLWNSAEGEAYVTDLLQTNGHGGGRVGRDGFPEKVWQEIFRLNVLYRKPRPKPGR
ncbi:MAG: hypothetical protein ACLQHK_03525 [Gallionellaceae bacterium]